MKYLIVGLGNPGEKYKNTRHNIGYKVLDFLAESAGISFSDKRYAYVSEMKHKGKTLILVKPTTYMNLSGKAVNYYLQAEKIPIENLMVVVDDISLEIGKIRIKAKGSSGGHNGLQNIQDILGTVNYNRLRFGIGNNFYQGGQVDYVLGEWTDDELKILPERIEMAAEAIKSFPLIGIDRTMNFYNNK
ncbi:MAG: aminoacyl-tRNA hydrolase [Bacteroidales bacterium]|jgi:PTH1 family peptidyl-tRNA hydrolase|nr:aminoacyl-tRNA hydrolase [Bacteroidales bacterium]HOL97710.1 aminoacyl-tRNA hydrolase [Bacteroidales bacterium]HOM36337.1 aminoacyl-tRNA hydrolase [Bacteroidales bacterium]HPD23621.1 aminoacyl-tRNA hydrolase [Bacteroidales bacterium]HRS99466.1 aminoacyl-tRNA hydrolase [Bacteroidales bacterium]